MFSEMQKKLRDVGISPIFFVGSGISRRYIGSPDWIGLLKQISESKSLNFERVKQKHIDVSGNIQYEEFAQELETLYFDKLDDSEIIEGASKPYYFREGICSIVNEYLSNAMTELENNKEIIELRKTSPAAIITTNYDKLLELVFGDNYSVRVGQNSLLTSTLDGVGEIYKIHGCTSDPYSIVITKNDYDNFFEKNIYLNSKLLTLFLEYPIVFLGYSVSDRNVKSILSTIIKMLSADKVEELKSRMWFISKSDDNADIKEVVRINLDDGLFIDINGFKLAHYDRLYSAISDISIKRLPMKFLKYLKSNLYELIASQEYNPKLLDVNIKDIENISDFSTTNQFVGLTFSTKEKRIYNSTIDMCKAFLYDESVMYDSKNILRFKKGKQERMPLYKFLQDMSAEEILDYIKQIAGESSNFYKNMVNDTCTYKINLGIEKKIEDFTDLLTVENIVTYAEKYVQENELYLSQTHSVECYIILNIIENRLEEIIVNEEIRNVFADEIIRALTNCSEEFIKANCTSIIKLTKQLDDGSYKQHFRYLLCYLDKILYRGNIFS